MEERRAQALSNCEAQIRFFTGMGRQARIFYRVYQIATIVLGGLTPVVLLLDLSGVSSRFVAALFAALAAIAAGLSGAFHLQEAWARNAYFAQALTSEREKFLTRTTAGYGVNRTEEEALDRFVTRVEELRMAEASQWRDFERAAQRLTGAPDANPSGGASGTGAPRL